MMSDRDKLIDMGFEADKVYLIELKTLGMPL
jgi:hypothetical protein